MIISNVEHSSLIRKKEVIGRSHGASFTIRPLFCVVLKLTRNTDYRNNASNLQVWRRSTETKAVKFAAYRTITKFCNVNIIIIAKVI
jgi:hypothetical protein